MSGEMFCVMTSNTCLCVRVSSCSLARSCAWRAAISCSAYSLAFSCACRLAISWSCSCDLRARGRELRGAGDTSGKPCDEVSVLIVDDEESMLFALFAMLLSVVCAVFSMFMVLFCVVYFSAAREFG